MPLPFSYNKDPFNLPVLFLTLLLTASLIYAALELDYKNMILAEQVMGNLHSSGVESPVTAVLLNFRGYDTILEVTVLLVSVIGVWSFNTAPFPTKYSDISPIHISVVNILAPVMCLAAFYLIWQGSHFAGGAFQGGAVLGGAGVLILVSEIKWANKIPVLFLQSGLTVGLALFTLIGLYCMYINNYFLEYPRSVTSHLILIIETCSGISIGFSLASLFAGGRPSP